MKKSLINIIVLCVSISIVLVISEFTIRLTNIAYEPQYDNRVKITQTSPNPVVGYELIPNFKGQALGGFVDVNSYGFRGPEVSRKKPEGIKRVAVLGDSWAFGWGVNQDDVVTAVLEKELNKLGNNVKYEVLNFSLFGYNLQQEETILKEKVLAFEPDIVIFAFNINDLEGLKLKSIKGIHNEYQNTEGRMKLQENNFTFKDILFKALRKIEGFGNERSHLFRLIDNVFRGLAIRFHFENPGKRYYFKQFYREETYEFMFLKSAFHRISELSNKHNFKVCIIYFPWMNELTQDNPYTEAFGKVKNVAETKGFLTLNLFPFFYGHDVNKLRISKIDGHPTALGHKIAADTITKFISMNIE